MQLGDLRTSEKVAAFDFDGTLANTAVRRHGADAWSLMFPTIPQKLQQLHDDGFRIVSRISDPSGRMGPFSEATFSFVLVLYVSALSRF